MWNTFSSLLVIVLVVVEVVFCISLVACSEAPHGTIRFLSDVGQVEVVKFYWSSEPLQFGDQVQFKIVTRSYDNLVYALDIVVEQTAKEIRFRVRWGRR